MSKLSKAIMIDVVMFGLMIRAILGDEFAYGLVTGTLVLIVIAATIYGVGAWIVIKYRDDEQVSEYTQGLRDSLASSLGGSSFYKLYDNVTDVAYVLVFGIYMATWMAVAYFFTMLVKVAMENAVKEVPREQ